MLISSNSTVGEGPVAPHLDGELVLRFLANKSSWDLFQYSLTSLRRFQVNIFKTHGGEGPVAPHYDGMHFSVGEQKLDAKRVLGPPGTPISCPHIFWSLGTPFLGPRVPQGGVWGAV